MCPRDYSGLRGSRGGRRLFPLAGHGIIHRSEGGADPHDRGDNADAKADQTGDSDGDSQESHKEYVPSMPLGQPPALLYHRHGLHLAVHHQVSDERQAAGKDNARDKKQNDPNSYDGCLQEAGQDHIYRIFQKANVKNRVQLINLIRSYKGTGEEAGDSKMVLFHFVWLKMREKVRRRPQRPWKV